MLGLEQVKEWRPSLHIKLASSLSFWKTPGSRSTEQQTKKYKLSRALKQGTRSILVAYEVDHQNHAFWNDL